MSYVKCLSMSFRRRFSLFFLYIQREMATEAFLAHRMLEMYLNVFHHFIGPLRSNDAEK